MVGGESFRRLVGEDVVEIRNLCIDGLGNISGVACDVEGIG